MTMTTLRENPSAFGSERAFFKAGKSLVPPPPRWRSIMFMAWLMFGGVAGTDCLDITDDPPANSRTLNLSVGLRLPMRSLRSFLDMLRGKPCMEPETSTMNMYSRGGICTSLTRFGGCSMSRKKFSSFPSNRRSPVLILPPASLYFSRKSRLAPYFSDGSSLTDAKACPS